MGPDFSCSNRAPPSSRTPKKKNGIKYLLHQNYPNPFNPKTNIKYQILKSSDVKLTVFDINGKQVVNLVNQKQVAGTYEVDLSGGGYASGVYIYSLFVDGVIIDTKKMILIK